ncbi:hypothetical protein [Dokdonia sp. PRO95]|uniref:hypothetical protein n=1 Tax=Dokdonia sp. PRO95 TaxID=1239415 RepID=UPI00069227FF|nr:hypothetical protein [Dokdonia sp. PRO95]
MKSIIKIALAATVIIFAQNVHAQDTESPVETEKEQKIREMKEWKAEYDKEHAEENEQKKHEQITALNKRKEDVIKRWKEALKVRIEAGNRLRDSGFYTQEELETSKKKAAEEVALNIENELAIINNQIELVKRTGHINSLYGTSVEIGLGGMDQDGNRVLGVAVNRNRPGVTNYDRRTYGETVFAMGLNNAISDNADIGDDFSIGKSTFVELGYAWKTRVFENSGALQFKYGLSLQSNFLSIKDNRTLESVDGENTFQEFPFDLKKAKIRVTNLVVPLHFEFGGWKKEQKEDYVRYRTGGKFRMGIGGYAGVRLGTQQKLKYKENGDRVKTKSRQDYDGDNLVYGLSSYIRVTGDLSLYAKYDLSSAFKTEELGEVNNVSLGLRLDL